MVPKLADPLSFWRSSSTPFKYWIKYSWSGSTHILNFINMSVRWNTLLRNQISSCQHVFYYSMNFTNSKIDRFCVYKKTKLHFDRLLCKNLLKWWQGAHNWKNYWFYNENMECSQRDRYHKTFITSALNKLDRLSLKMYSQTSVMCAGVARSLSLSKGKFSITTSNIRLGLKYLAVTNDLA